MFLTIIEVLILIAIIGFMITQMAIPAIEQKPLFPMFRGEGKLLDDLEHAHEDTYLARLSREVLEAKETAQKEQDRVTKLSEKGNK